MRLSGALLLFPLTVALAQKAADQPASFKTSVTLVTVPTVVRDGKGHAVGGLRREDFRLFDNGKPQEIAEFSVERIGGSEPSAERLRSAGLLAAGKAAAMPDRFVAYLFDDLHLKFADMVRIRDAAARHFKSSLQPGDRAAIYSTSGQTMLEFTSERDKLDETLSKLRPRPMSNSSGFECPDIGFYQSDLMVNHHDTQATDAAVTEQMVCTPSVTREEALMMVMSHARQVLHLGELETRVALRVISDVIRRMSALPGKRQIVLASPGFLTPDLQQEESAIIDRAIRNNISIGAIDARGLWTDPTLDASKRTISSEASITKASIERASASLENSVLAELAAGTGGRFYQNSNDLDDGIHQVAAAPEYVYLLAFSPLNLKLDGKYHNLKVGLENGKGLTPEARKGYFAPKGVMDPAKQAKQDIFDAVFTRDERSEISMDIGTQYFRPTDQIARVAVLSHLPLKGILFRKVDERNCNELTIVSAVFDSNGNVLSGKQQKFELRLKDETVARRAESGLTSRMTYDFPPGAYLVRVVVRDAEGRMAARNSPLEIPGGAGLDGLMESAIHGLWEAKNGASLPPETTAMQAPYFYSSAGTANVRIAAEVPAGAAPGAEVTVIGTAYTPGGRPAARFTKMLGPAGAAPLLFEDQFDLLPGRYRIELLFHSAGAEFGKTEAPLVIEPHAIGQFAISGIALSRTVRKRASGDDANDDAGLDPLSPLRTEQYEYPPAGVRRFHATDDAAFYVTLYDAMERDPERLTVQFRILDRRSGSVKLDWGPSDATRFMRPGTSRIGLGIKLPVETLSPGDYQLELTATDPAGRKATRSVAFEMM